LTTPKLESPYQADWANLKEVEVTGKYTGTIILSEPFVPLMTSTLPIQSGLVVSKKAVEELGDDFVTQPVGTGPYELTSWTANQEIVFTKFADYSGAWQPTIPEPVWERIVVVPITDETAGLNAFESGDVSWTRLPNQSVAGYEAGQGKGDYYALNTPDYAFVTMNILDEYLSNPDLRMAIRYAVDVPGIVTAATDDAFPRATSIIPPNIPVGYWAEAPVYDQDLEKAKEYMAKTGFTGLNLRITAPDEEEMRATAQVLAENLAAIGIDSTIDMQDTATYNEIPGNGLGGADRQLVVCRYSGQPDPSWSFMWFTSEQVGLWNPTGWGDPTFQQLYDDALKEADPDKRTQIYIEMSKMWDEANNVIWTYWPSLNYASAENIEPYFLAPNGLPLFWAFQPK
jgi:peptide/nickel transport system substrate-binding protein